MSEKDFSCMNCPFVDKLLSNQRFLIISVAVISVGKDLVDYLIKLLGG